MSVASLVVPGVWSDAAAAEVRRAEATAEEGAIAAVAPTGAVVGVVTDAEGVPVNHVLISLSGPSGTALVICDSSGRFEFRLLIPGRYLLRTHLTTQAPGTRQVVEVGPDVPVVRSLALSAEPGVARPTVRLAGMGLRPTFAGAGRSGASVEEQEAGAVDAREVVRSPEGTASAPHDHGTKAWRLRRARRSVLKDRDTPASGPEPVDGGDPQVVWPAQWVALSGESLESRPLTDLVGGAPVSGEVQLLTRATLSRSGEPWSLQTVPGQVAYVSLAQAGDGDGAWALRGAVDMAAGDAASWAVAGSYAVDPHDDHAIDVGLSYSKRSYETAMDLLPSGSDESGFASREVGSIEAFDTWSVSEALTVGYGANFARYGYLEDGKLLSPRAHVTMVPVRRTRVRMALSQNTAAPGAEQLLPPIDGVWLAPARTFTSLSRFDDLQAERARHLEVAVERDLGHASVVSVRRFRQDVSDQLITMFGTGRHVPLGTLPAPGGHYYLASTSGVTTEGWGVTFSHDTDGRLRGVVDYSVVRAQWDPWTASGLSPRTVGVFRTGFERFHDVTTTLETEFPETSTRVFARCRVNTAFARSHHEAVTSGLDARFDIRVTQALPFSPFDGSSWEVLVAFRSLFHEQTVGASAYDELLVVDPPRQFVGGLVVHF